MNVGREIARQMAQIEAEQAEEELTARYRRAKEIVLTIPSGARDADLSPEQAAAMDEYDVTVEALAELREPS